MVIKLLNDTQQKELSEVLTYYKFFYICNECGSIYGTDKKEVLNRLCKVCELKRDREKRA